MESYRPQYAMNSHIIDNEIARVAGYFREKYDNRGPHALVLLEGISSESRHNT